MIGYGTFHEQPDYVRGQVEALTLFMALVISTLDEKQRDFVMKTGHDLAKATYLEAQDEDTKKDSARALGVSNAFYEINEKLLSFQEDYQNHRLGS